MRNRESYPRSSTKISRFLNSSAEETETEMVARATRAFVREARSYYGTSGNANNTYEFYPDYSPDKVLQLIRSDSISWGAINTLSDRVLESGWKILDDQGKRDYEAEEYLRAKGIDFWLREMLMNYFVFNNAFGEVVYGSSRVKELHTLPTQQIRMEADAHGEILFYYQNPSKEARWAPNEILHIHDPSFDLNTWGEIGLKTLWQALLIKYHVKKFLVWLFETNQFRGYHNIQGADEEAVKAFFQSIKAGEADISKPNIFEGEHEFVIGRNITELSALNEILYKMDEEVLNLLQVPPIYAGLPDNSNRSNSDAQERAFDTRIKSIHKLFEYHLNDLLLRMKLFKRKFIFTPLLSTKDEQQVIEIVVQMKSMGMKEDIISDYLRSKGFELPEGKIFEPPELPTLPGASPGNSKLDPKADQYPSRKGKATGEGNDKIGTGVRGTTRQDQLVKRAYNSYPYTYEVDD